MTAAAEAAPHRDRCSHPATSATAWPALARKAHCAPACFSTAFPAPVAASGPQLRHSSSQLSRDTRQPRIGRHQPAGRVLAVAEARWCQHTGRCAGSGRTQNGDRLEGAIVDQVRATSPQFAAAGCNPEGTQPCPGALKPSPTAELYCAGVPASPNTRCCPILLVRN